MSLLNKAWMSRRWFDFRLGHSTYLIFALSFGNFVLIFHRLFIERVPALNEIFSSLWIFVFVFILAYIPIAIIIGIFILSTLHSSQFFDCSSVGLSVHDYHAQICRHYPGIDTYEKLHYF